ncbi:type I pullulanase [Mycoplasmatota bacterium]|nr:type I pullulanase [Mycoplasmatota bacterium]
MNHLFNAYLDDFNKVTIILPKNYFQGRSRSFILIHENEEIDLFIEQVIDIGDYNKYICLLPTFVELGVLYFVKDEYGNQTVLQSGAIVRSSRFDTLYYYEKKDLGVTYRKEASTFKLWAPTATKVSLIIKSDEQEYLYPMRRCKKGIYEVIIKGDLDGKLYRYLVTNNNREREIIDVYGISSNANLQYSAIINPEKLIDIKPLSQPIKEPTDAIIYEMNIRDFSIDKNNGVKYKGKYLGLTEKNTKSTNNNPTGLDYLINLGITHVQILPFFDFGGVDELDPDKMYNWGYNPEQYNTPEGSYSLYPNDVYSRLNELRQMINVLHEYNIGVIMDVVYNHVHNMNTFPFDHMIPGYFFRYNQYGMPTNGSGCGNDLATEREMVRKFIIDSVKYWAKTYQLDGFRFDLMGLIDIETMNRIRRELNDINPGFLLYGEGWNLNTALPNELKSTLTNAYKLPGIYFFNDQYRDFIKGNTFVINDLGYPFGHFEYLESVKQMLAGSVGYEKQKTHMFFEPYQTINYIECHDNFTMYDKIKLAKAFEPKEKRIKRQRLATSMLLLSQGIPMIHSGQEFYRTKYGVENSYNSPDKINMINWKRMDDHIQDVHYIQELIKVRKSHQAFHFNSAAKIKKHLTFLESDQGVIIILLHNVKQYGCFNDIQIIFNCTEEDFAYRFDDDYKLLFDEKAYLLGKDIPNYLIIKALSVMIIGK